MFCSPAQYRTLKNFEYSYFSVSFPKCSLGRLGVCGLVKPPPLYSLWLPSDTWMTPASGPSCVLPASVMPASRMWTFLLRRDKGGSLLERRRRPGWRMVFIDGEWKWQVGATPSRRYTLNSLRPWDRAMSSVASWTTTTANTGVTLYTFDLYRGQNYKSE